MTVNVIVEPRIVFFSSVTENTRKFVDKLGLPSERIPLYGKDKFLEVDYPYVLFIPTYGGGSQKGAVPKQVIKFLNNEQNRNFCTSIINSGNINFGEDYGLAGRIISAKLQVPTLYNFELMGMPEDVVNVREGILNNWEKLLEMRGLSNVLV